jgi:hypothetical protein
VAHPYNPSYSRGKDQEDRGSKSAWANSPIRLSQKTLHKKGLEWLKVWALSSSPSTKKKKKKERNLWSTNFLEVCIILHLQNRNS